MLDLFSGPMDLLLYLIRRQKMDILDLPILKITEQYMVYVDMMRELKLELAADYLLMAAMLAEIKSRMLLPQKHDDETTRVTRAPNWCGVYRNTKLSWLVPNNWMNSRSKNAIISLLRRTPTRVTLRGKHPPRFR